MAAHVAARHAIDGARAFLQRRRRAAGRGAGGRACASAPSSASSRSSPGEICVIPRGVIFRVELIDGPARAYVCENYGGAFTLPDRGPIGANCLANPRDFQTPVAAYEDSEEPSTLYVKWGGELFAHRDRPFAARRRRLARQLRSLQIRPAALLAGRRDPVRPSRSVDLHGADRAVGDARHRQHRLRHLPGALGGRREHLPAAVVSPQPHVGVHGARLRRL